MDDTTPRATDATMLADRAVLRLSGDDVRGFLQGLLTVDTGGPLPRWAALLTPQGKVLFDMLLWADGDDMLVDCEREQADALARRLAMYRLRRAIAIVRDDTLAVHWSRDRVVADSLVDPRLTALGWRWIAPPGPAVDGWHAHRLSHGVVEGIGELGSGETLWLECNAAELGGVDFAKGCYVGQENTARMHYRAKVNRRLVVAALDPADDRIRAAYADLALMVVHRRIDALGNALVPDWLSAALSSAERQ